MAGGKEMWKDLKSQSSEELLEKMATGRFAERIQGMAKIVLEEREKSERKEEFVQMLKATKDNATSTKKLVIATWGLVVVTLLLVVLAWLKEGV